MKQLTKNTLIVSFICLGINKMKKYINIILELIISLPPHAILQNHPTRKNGIVTNCDIPTNTFAINVNGFRLPDE